MLLIHVLSAMNDEVGIDADIDHPRARARAHVRVGNDEIGPDADIDHPRARARAHVHAKTTSDLDAHRRHPRARAMNDEIGPHAHRVNNSKIGPDADVSHPRARAHFNVRANNDKPGFFDRLHYLLGSKPAGPVDNNVHPHCSLPTLPPGCQPYNKDLKITARIANI